MAISEDSQSGLSKYLQELFSEFEKNRKPLESEAQKNLDAFKSISNGFWKDGEAGSSGDDDDDWRSDTFVPLTAEKVMAAFALIMDTVIQGGKIPLTLVRSPYEEDAPEDLPDEQRETEEEAL